MAERMFGIETEYAITGFAGDTCVPRESLVFQILKTAQKQVASLPDMCGNGIYLENGSRFYIDCGLHPEYATPECVNPWDAVRYVKAGEQLIVRVLGQLEQEQGKGWEVLCFICNVDYGDHSTWGSHESYLHRTDPAHLPAQLIPHLVSRVIYTGAGGFNPLCSGIEFTLSPRVSHIVKVVSGDSTVNRGIFHTKDESLSSRGYHRLHVLCGESLCSEAATWLRVGATALVVAMIEGGLNPGAAVELQSPLDALRTVASDPSYRATLRLSKGGNCSALEIQRHYLAQAEAHAGEKYMPPWAEQVCVRWRATLDLLECGPQAVETTLDWAIKRALYSDYAGRRGIPWESISHWNFVLDKLNKALEGVENRDGRVTPAFVLGPESPIRGDVERLTPYLDKHKMAWDGLDQFLKMKRQLFEIDTRFGQLGDRGIFRSLDRAGVLTHHVAGVDNIEHAMNHPPAAGRARLRGETVQKLCMGGIGHLCDWQGVWDASRQRMLDLSNPFTAEAKWQDMPQGNLPDEGEVFLSLLRMGPRFRRVL